MAVAVDSEVRVVVAVDGFDSCVVDIEIHVVAVVVTVAVDSEVCVIAAVVAVAIDSEVRVVVVDGLGSCVADVVDAEVCVVVDVISIAVVVVDIISFS